MIHHPDFTITSTKKNIYSGTDEEMKTRFVTFSSLAAELLTQLPKPDIIHLHDWHVAGVELKLRNQNKEIAPIVFTYHNNQQASQGRYFTDQYNYNQVIRGLQEAGIADRSVNLMVDAVKKADCVTTVSTEFSVESQSIDTGEGISFAMREAAKEETLWYCKRSTPGSVGPPTTSRLEKDCNRGALRSYLWSRLKRHS